MDEPPLLFAAGFAFAAAGFPLAAGLLRPLLDAPRPCLAPTQGLTRLTVCRRCCHGLNTSPTPSSASPRLLSEALADTSGPTGSGSIPRAASAAEEPPREAAARLRLRTIDIDIDLALGAAQCVPGGPRHAARAS